MIKLYSLLLSVLLSSCFAPALNYLGSSYTPTKDVDVYVDVAAIKKRYTIMGKSYFEMSAFFTLEQVQQAAIEKAKEKGADAILIRDYFTQEGGSVQTITNQTALEDLP
ncbi:MAG TPA: hypothetical protein VL095_14790 [Flavisolibacter sp.]|nr:hypothetical protein [Flavisolibacter sp.]